MATVLTAVVAGVVGGPGPLDDPSRGEQRPGFLIDPDEARVVRGLDIPAPIGVRPVFVAFGRQPPDPAELRDGLEDVAPGVASVLVLARGSGGGAATGVPVVLDARGRVADAVGLDSPRDGGPPIGYALIDRSARVRYATLDPTWTRQGFEVALITRAVR